MSDTGFSRPVAVHVTNQQYRISDDSDFQLCVGISCRKFPKNGRCVLCDLAHQFVSFGGDWIEIAYGTSAGTVCIIVQHPETLGQGPQLFQTFSVHCSPVIRVMISEKHLVSGIFILSVF